jgi:hypothetical protein
VETLLAPLSDASNAWHELAREVIAYEDLRSGNTGAALLAYKQIAADPDAPAGLKTRVDAMARFIKAGGDANYGTVPEPAPAKVSAPPAKASPPAKDSAPVNRPGGTPVR